jgi:arylsulfate sulfotransferase
MTLVSYFGFRTSNVPQTPFIFDEFGDVRWYLDFSTTPVLNALFYDNGGSGCRTATCTWRWRHRHHLRSRHARSSSGRGHARVRLPSQRAGEAERQLPRDCRGRARDHRDFVIEIDRVSRQVIRTWTHLAAVWPAHAHQRWARLIHVNAVAYDARDNTIIISGRTQGVVKLDENNRVVWILGAHRGWGTAGDGTDLRTKLLQPLDRNGVPITDPALLDGTASHPDFEWSWYQHAPLVMPSGHVLIFDNGDNRNLGGAPAYSRAAEYDIDDVNRTVRQA